MKKAILLAITCSTITLISCKKSYSCACTTKVSNPSITSESTFSESYSEKMKEKQAKASCSNTKEILDKQVKKDYDGTGFTTSVSCEVK